MGKSDIKSQVQRRLKRVAGQVAGLQKMVEDERYCVEILDQIAAVRSALDAVGVVILSSHIESCVAGSGTDSQQPQGKALSGKALSGDELIEEVHLTLKRFLK